MAPTRAMKMGAGGSETNELWHCRLVPQCLCAILPQLRPGRVDAPSKLRASRRGARGRRSMPPSWLRPG
eukprot:223762-Pyramimonas_sp.AAC.1